MFQKSLKTTSLAVVLSLLLQPFANIALAAKKTPSRKPANILADFNESDRNAIQKTFGDELSPESILSYAFQELGAKGWKITDIGYGIETVRKDHALENIKTKATVDFVLSKPGLDYAIRYLPPKSECTSEKDCDSFTMNIGVYKVDSSKSIVEQFQEKPKSVYSRQIKLSASATKEQNALEAKRALQGVSDKIQRLTEAELKNLEEGEVGMGVIIPLLLGMIASGVVRMVGLDYMITSKWVPSVMGTTSRIAFVLVTFVAMTLIIAGFESAKSEHEKPLEELKKQK